MVFKYLIKKGAQGRFPSHTQVGESWFWDLKMAFQNDPATNDQLFLMSGYWLIANDGITYAANVRETMGQGLKIDQRSIYDYYELYFKCSGQI